MNSSGPVTTSPPEVTVSVSSLVWSGEASSTMSLAARPAPSPGSGSGDAPTHIHAHAAARASAAAHAGTTSPCPLPWLLRDRLSTAFLSLWWSFDYQVGGAQVR